MRVVETAAMTPATAPARTSEDFVEVSAVGVSVVTGAVVTGW